MGRRDVPIDSLRGVAILLMVAGHVIGADESLGMGVGPHSGWRFGYDLLVDLRMPLFTALSGLVYGLRPLGPDGDLTRFMIRKSRRLLVPLITVGTGFVVLRAIAPGTNSTVGLNSWWRIYVDSDDTHFWFLQAIFLIILAVAVLDRLGVLRHPRTLWTALGAATLLATLAPTSEP